MIKKLLLRFMDRLSFDDLRVYYYRRLREEELKKARVSEKIKYQAEQEINEFLKDGKHVFIDELEHSPLLGIKLGDGVPLGLSVSLNELRKETRRKRKKDKDDQSSTTSTTL